MKQKFLIIGILLIVVISPVILILPSYYSIFDFSESGEIGDTIGGITAPIINGVGAYLVYISFRAQTKANEDQRERIDREIERSESNLAFESIFRDIDILRRDISEYSIGDKGWADSFESVLTRAENILKVRVDIGSKFTKDIHLHRFHMLLILGDNILTRIENSILLVSQKSDLKNKLLFVYQSKLSKTANDLRKVVLTDGLYDYSEISLIIDRLESIVNSTSNS